MPLKAARLVLMGVSIAVTVAPTVVLPLDCQAAGNFASFQSQNIQEFQQYRKSMQNEFLKYRSELRSAFKDYRHEATVVWGESDAKLPDRKRIVEYGDNMTERRTIDFEKGVVRVDIAFPLAMRGNSDQIKQRMTDLVKRVVTEPADSRSIIDIAKAPSDTRRRGAPVLAGLVENDHGQAVTIHNAMAFAQHVIRHVTKRSQVGGDGKKRMIVSAEFPLLPNYIQTLAQKYENIITYYSTRQSLNARLVFALIETESFFNPVARSNAPAFGLMQLVPSSGARDAYMAIYGRAKIVTDSYLYNPKHNVNLGTAYLRLIDSKYLSHIRNKKSRLWCTIAAYNTGVTNVLGTFAGQRSHYYSNVAWREMAFRRVNAMSSAEVFRQLRLHLPYNETRQYIVKIRERMSKYTVFH